MPGSVRNPHPVQVTRQVSLAPFTTLGLGGPARGFVEAGTRDALAGVVRSADESGEPLLVLGGGSNLVVADEGFPGTVVRVATRGVRPGLVPGEDAVAVTVAAGEDWDETVAWSVAEGLAGIECLSGIPGLAGATPIQNVGAYGQEVGGTIATVRVYDRVRGQVSALSRADCRFGYRDSVFKRGAFPGSPGDPGLPGGPAGSSGPGGAEGPEGAGRSSGPGVSPTRATGRFVILDVTFRLTRSPLSLPVRYRDLAASLDVAEGDRVPLADARAAVLHLRRAKGMVLDPADPDTRSAGSFFTNPVLSVAHFAALERAVAHVFGVGTRVPRFAADGGVKVPAAWLIEHAGFAKGYRGARPAPEDGIRISSKHTLALVNPGGGTTAALLALAREIRNGVRDTFDVELACEPVLVGARL